MYKLQSTQTRNANYEQILRIINDTLQGMAVGSRLKAVGYDPALESDRRGQSGALRWASMEGHLRR